mgnify:CR=1 FL=1
MTVELSGKYYVFFQNEWVEFSESYVKFIEEQADEIVKNGYIQPIDGYLPVKTDFEPIPVIFDFCDYPEVSSYIAAKGKGQLYQQVSRDDDDTYTALTKFIGRQEIVPQVSS